MTLPDLFYDEDQHRHICEVCMETWWHDAVDPSGGCEVTWAWDCPFHTGMDRACVGEAA